jgi:arylsulfatase A
MKSFLHSRAKGRYNMSRAMKLIAILLSFFACFWNSLRAAEKPNIVFILADDLGYGDLGCYNMDSKIPTPYLDQLASEGMRFTDAHSPSSVCTPTRYALLTGRYAWRTRLQRNVLGPWDKPLIAPDRLTVGKLLQQHGYATACIGKWHLGQNYSTTDGKQPIGGAKNALSNVDFTQPITDGPMTRGFDHYFGTIVPNYPPYCFIKNDRTVGNPSILAKGGNFNIPGPMVPGWKLENILPEMTRHAVQWVEDTAKTQKPFFLFFSLTSPHYPVVPATEFIGKSKAGQYGDFVHQTDWSIGQVLDAIERNGIADNTLIIFTSDNGSEVTGEVKPGVYDRVQQFGHRSSGELRGAKRDAWEGGHRVPFIARWPGKIESGSESKETMCHVDFIATVAAILGKKLPDNAGEDSFSILPVLFGEKLTAPIREATVHHSAKGKFAVRQGEWVLITAPSGDDNLTNGEPMWLKSERGYTEHSQPGELFNVREDLSQRQNLYTEKPEIVIKLTLLLGKYVQDGRSTPGTPQANDVEIQPYSILGTPAKPKLLP